MLNKNIIAQSEIISNAKVNIGLNISAKLDNNYHKIETLIQEISLSDEISIKIYQRRGNIKILQEGINIECAEEQNTCYVMANFLKKKFNLKNKITIKIKKNIPTGSGLGGGSSNAAATLRCLDESLQLRMSKIEKNKICTSIGMDVPFFLDGGLQFAENMGEKLKPISSIFRKHFFLLVFPRFGISTSWAYNHINKRLPSKKKLYNLLALKESINFDLFGNDFETIVIPRYPEIREVKKLLLSSNALFSSLSGSGSTVFGIFKNFDDVLKASELLKQKKYHSTIAHPVYR